MPPPPAGPCCRTTLLQLPRCHRHLVGTFSRPRWFPQYLQPAPQGMRPWSLVTSGHGGMLTVAADAPWLWGAGSCWHPPGRRSLLKVPYAGVRGGSTPRGPDLGADAAPGPVWETGFWATSRQGARAAASEHPNILHAPSPPLGEATPRALGVSVPRGQEAPARFCIHVCFFLAGKTPGIRLADPHRPCPTSRGAAGRYLCC